MDINVKTGATQYLLQGLKYFIFTFIALAITVLIVSIIFINVVSDINAQVSSVQLLTTAIIALAVILIISVLITWFLARLSINTKQQREKLLTCLTALDNSSDSMVISDLRGKTIYFNARASMLLGLNYKEHSIKTFNSLIAQDCLSDAKEQLQKLDAEKSVDFESVFARENGALIPVEVHSQTILLQGKRHVLSVIRDVTEQKQKAEELKISSEKLKNAMEGTINTLSLAAEVRDPYTAGHQQRVSLLAVAIANELGLAASQIEGIRVASSLHDIGKIYVPAEILSKPGKLKINEFNLVRDHAEVGYELLKSIEFPWPVAEIILQHHERFNGSGYPRGLSGDNIMLEASIIAVSDVVESMASHRPYRPAFHVEKALLEILQNKGTLYHPDVVDTCLYLFNEKGFNF
jgi:PAS domain S-box-containing protein/putative nucleotidyltransferase with HDIG domain